MRAAVSCLARPARFAAVAVSALAVACTGHSPSGGSRPSGESAPSSAPASPPGAPAVALPTGPTGGASDRCPGGAPKNPVEYGLCRLAQSKGRAKSDAKVVVILANDPAGRGVAVDGRPESYAIVTQNAAQPETLVVGRDPVGAMYGALDVAERLDEYGASALPLTAPVKASPALPIRGANLIVAIPEEKRPWWFREPAFWTEYLDLMARARLNFLDLHGMYNLGTALFVNPLGYFAESASHPGVGLPRGEREANLAMLNTVIGMAKVRGIKVGLMSYNAEIEDGTDGSVEASGKGAGRGAVSSKHRETREEKEEGPTYTREAVFDLATRAPGLDYLGFRVGESGRKPEWYKETYLAGLKQAHSRAIPYTRSWKTTKKALTRILAESGPEALIEVKYNGEQLGSPYVISGGNMERWATYSYEDFLTPPTPYRFVFQVRAGGTHRIFRYASFERTRRTVRSMLMSSRVAGMTLEAPHAYSPQRDFYHANPADSFSPYAFRRDELAYLEFGRLAYDPNTPEHVFRAMLRERVGTDALWEPVQAATDITPWIQQAHTCGPDQRHYAPELELGGPVAYWATPLRTKGPKNSCVHKGSAATGGASQLAFDEFAIAIPHEAATDLLEGRGTARLSPVDVALLVLGDVKAARAAASVAVDPANVEARDYVRECADLADLGAWFAHKLRGATALAVYEGGGPPAWLDAARAETREADAAYASLAKATSYILPFEDRMRMKVVDLTLFHWKENLPRLAEDAESIDAVAREAHDGRHPKGALPDPSAWLDAARAKGPGLARLDVSPDSAGADSWVVTATFGSAIPAGARVSILHRPFESQGPDWAAVVATASGGSGAQWSATVPGTHAGGMFAVEVEGGPGAAWRYPDVTRETPYRAVAP